MRKKTLYAFVISFILLVTVIILNRRTFHDMNNYFASVQEAHEVITTLESLSNHFKSAQIYTQTYQNDSLKNFYRFYKKDADSIPGQLDYLKKMVQNDSQQTRMIREIDSLINVHLPAVMEQNIAEMISSGQTWRLHELFNIHRLIDKSIEFEKRSLADEEAYLDNSSRTNNLLTTALGMVAIGIILLTFLSNFFLSQERLWLEGFLASILNTSQNGIIHYKAIREHGKIIDFKIEFVNKAIHNLMGFYEEELLGKKLSEVPAIMIESDLAERFRRVVENGTPVEFESLFKRGKIERWFLVSLAHMDDGLIASFNNITQLKKYEAELKNNISELERSNSELEQYAYVASHDLQEPLRKIRSFGSYLQDTQGERLNEKGKEQLDKIMRSAERMSVLIRDILTFSSLKKQGDFVEVDLNSILRTVTQDLDLMIQQKKATIHSDDLPTIEAIPLQMNQLFYNLINNSLKFGKSGVPLVISVKSRIVPETEKLPALVRDRRYYEISFTDNGIGFSQEYAEQIFGLFKRLNDKQVYPGSGIGLSLCKKVVINHSGDIQARGAEDQGATFLVYLPEMQG